MNVYRVRIKSEHAKGLQFYFGRFRLPPRAKLFMYAYNRETVYGAFTWKNNQKKHAKPGGIEFSTVPLKGNDWIIELNVPKKGPQGDLAIELVSHIF